MTLLYIHWNPDPILLHLGGFELRWYSLLWVIGLSIAIYIAGRIFKSRQLPEQNFNRLFTYTFLGIFIGARLGHCLFYDWSYYSEHLAEIILPVRFLPDGGWKFTGYAGLASHGGTAGLIIALILFCRKTRMKFLDIADIIALATPITAGCIRIANLMNSEIIGRPSDVPWAFIFEQVDSLPRHPAQLYEALAYFGFAMILYLVYRRNQWQKGYGLYFGLCIGLIFTFRFFIELLKENQEAFEDNMLLNMGQLLSIPFVIAGIYFVVHAIRTPRITHKR